MSDYIKRSDVMNILHGGTFWTGLAKEIQALPAADVVEVVRCKDCKHNENTCLNHGKMRPRCKFTMFVRSANSFCSWGERKDNE